MPRSVPGVPKNWNFIVELPPRRGPKASPVLAAYPRAAGGRGRSDEAAVVEKSWKTDLPDGVDFDGQVFFFPEGLAVHAEVQWLEDSLLSARITVEASLSGKCARCLADAELAISDDLMYLYHLRGLVLGKDVKLESDEGFMPVEIDFWGRTLSLSDQVWETFVTLLPMKLLCRSDCAGLCPSCGCDLNEGSCSCEAQEADPRFEALRDVFPVGADGDPPVN